MTLRSHLVVLVGAIAVPLVVFACLMVMLVAQREDEAIERGLRDTARGYALAIDGEIQASISTLQALASSDHLEAGDLRHFYEEAKRVRAKHAAWPTVFLVDRSGQEIFTLLRPFGASLPNVAGDSDVVEAMRTRRPYVSDLIVGPVFGVPVVRVHTPVSGPQGHVRYLLSATLLPQHFAAVLGSSPRSGELVALVLDRAGTTIARASEARSWTGLPGPADLVDRSRAEGEGFFSSTALGPGKWYVAFSRVPSADFTVAIGVPVAKVGLGWVWTIAAGSALALVAALMLAAVMARAIRRPILALAARARAVGSGATMPDEARCSVDEVEVVRTALAEAAILAEERLREHERRVTADAARREAEAANHAKDRFLAMLSHDLRTPLTSMLTHIYILRASAPDSRAVHVLARLERSVRLQSRLVDDLLDLTRIAAGKLESHKAALDLRGGVRDAVDACGADADAKGVALSVALPDEPVSVLGDAVRLQQVVGNLLANAVKFTPSGGRVDVWLEPDVSTVRLVVRDTGAGIAAEFLPHVFEPFRQADTPSTTAPGGLGLGLAIVRHFVADHRGTVRAQSDGAGRGATFVVELPVLAAPLDARPGDDGVDGRVAGAGQAVLGRR